jgi:hypothetical protein
MSVFFNGISKRGGGKTMETTSGEIGVGLPLEPEGGDPYLGQIPSTVPSTAQAVHQTVPKYGPSTVQVRSKYGNNRTKTIQSRTIRQYDDNTGILLLVYLGFDQGNKQAKRGRGGVVVILFRFFWVDVAFQIGHIASKKKKKKAGIEHATSCVLFQGLNHLCKRIKYRYNVLNLIN